MYSPASRRIMAAGSSNKKSARALTNSVFPTPVGPKNTKAERAVWVAYSRTRTTNRIGNCSDCTFLMNHKALQGAAPCVRFLCFLLHELRDRIRVHWDTTAAMSSASTSSLRSAPQPGHPDAELQEPQAFSIQVRSCISLSSRPRSLRVGPQPLGARWIRWPPWSPQSHR